jgi:hypothetical protein
MPTRRLALASLAGATTVLSLPLVFPGPGPAHAQPRPTPRATPRATPSSGPTPTPTPAPTGQASQDMRSVFPIGPIDWNYSGFSIGADGSTLFVVGQQSYGTYDATNGEPFNVAVRSGGTWHSRPVVPADKMRFTYAHILPTTGNGAYVIATRTSTYADMGWAGGSNYVWSGAHGWYSPDWITTAPTEFTIGEARQLAGGTVCYWARSAVMTPDGAVHLLIASMTDSPVATNLCRYARIAGTTVTHEGLASNMTGYGAEPNYAIYLQNGASLCAISSWGGSDVYVFQCDSYGIPYGSPTFLHNNGPTYGPFWQTNPQTGSPDSSQIDVCWSASAQNEADFWVMRIALGPTPSAVWQEKLPVVCATGDAGCNWGPHKRKICRSPAGVLYVEAVTPGGTNASTGTPYHNAAIYRRDGVNTWTNVHTENTGREPGCMALGGEHTLYLQGWPNGWPAVSTGTV